MTFKPYNPTHSRARDRVSMTVRRPKGKNASLEWIIGGGTCESLGWRHGDRIEVMFGEAEHHGKVRLRKKAGGYKLAAHKRDRGRSAKKVRMNNLPPLMNKQLRPMTELKWRRTDDGNTIEADLPEDFYLRFHDVKRA